MNRAYIQRTEFVNYHTNEKTFGFRMFDDSGQTYVNIMEESDLKLSDEDFLRKAVEFFDETSSAIFDFALTYGIYVDGTWYNFDLNGEKWKLIEL